MLPIIRKYFARFNLTEDRTPLEQGAAEDPTTYPVSQKGGWQLYETVLAVDPAPSSLATPSTPFNHANNTVAGIIDLRYSTRLHVRGRIDLSGGSLTTTIVLWGINNAAGDVLIKDLVLSAESEYDGANYISNWETYDVGFQAYAHIYTTAIDITATGFIDIAVD